MSRRLDPSDLQDEPPETAEDRCAPQAAEASSGCTSAACIVRRTIRERVRSLCFGVVSPLTLRILAVNMLAPVLLVAGLFHLDRYRNELISAELESLRVRAAVIAAAIGEGAVVENGLMVYSLSPLLSRPMVRRLATPSHGRVRLFGADGAEIADSAVLLFNSSVIQIEELEPPEKGVSARIFRKMYDMVIRSGVTTIGLPPYRDQQPAQAADWQEVIQALLGDAAWVVRATDDHTLMLSVAVPVQRYKQVLGAVQLSADGKDITQSLFKVRLTVFQAFAFALAITITLSFYLAGTIAKPIRLLAAAADRVRSGQGKRHPIPDLTRRHDEIGDLSGALRDMTDVMWRRMDAIEAFAADVAHELKNPLTSLRSAVETVGRCKTAEQQQRLMSIIQDDVTRLDRLISDISDSSRLDAELSRADTEPVALRAMLDAMVAVYQDTGAAQGVRILVDAPDSDPLNVAGMESRLVQVLRNLIGNALSFSPPQGSIRLRGQRDGQMIVLRVEDDGPGIPENKLEAVFDRFYSERPSSEKFGTHSGLGLSISRQIIAAHGGTIRASNLHADNGTVCGACFTITLPALPVTAAGKVTGRGRLLPRR